MTKDSGMGKNRLPTAVQALVDGFQARKPMRTTSLVITLFGDAVSPHGGVIWLGSLVRAMAPLGINERLVRTSVFRLVQEGWLEGEREGRRSFYRFTDHGRQEYERAARRIYATEDTAWEGHWQLLMPLALDDTIREDFRRSLHWQGFRNLGGGLMAKPGGAGRALREALEEFGAGDKVLLFEATASDLGSPRFLRDTVEQCWQLEQTAQRYSAFLADFQPLDRLRQRGRQLAPEAAFTARALLIHDFRRALLLDTPLPAELLPVTWPGEEAQALTRRLYRWLAPPSMDYIREQLEAADGPMPEASGSFAERFPAG